MTTGEAIRRARRAKGLRQVDLAELIGASPATIKAWEQRDEPPVRSTYAAALIRVLGIDLYGDRADDDPVGPETPPAAADPADRGPALRDATDAELVAEFARRLANRPHAAHDQSNVRPFALTGFTVGDDVVDPPS